MEDKCKRELNIYRDFFHKRKLKFVYKEKIHMVPELLSNIIFDI